MVKHWIWQKKAVQNNPSIVPTYKYLTNYEESSLIKIFKWFFWKHKEATMIFIVGFLLGAWLF